MGGVSAQIKHCFAIISNIIAITSSSPSSSVGVRWWCPRTESRVSCICSVSVQLVDGSLFVVLPPGEGRTNRKVMPITRRFFNGLGDCYGNSTIVCVWDGLWRIGINPLLLHLVQNGDVDKYELWR